MRMETATRSRLQATRLPGTATSRSFNVSSPGVATQVVMMTQPPGNTTTANGFGLTVAIEDAGGEWVPQYTGTATVSIADGPAGAVIGGTLSVPIQNGTASFSELTLSQAGSYILQVSAASLTPALISAIVNTSPESGGGGGSPPPSLPAPPTIVGEQVLTTGRGKKAKLTGFSLTFNTALNAARRRPPQITRL